MTIKIRSNKPKPERLIVDSTDLLFEIKQEVVKCTKCELHKSRRIPVVGVGNHNADVLFVGEAPGEEEEKVGIPFVGPAGRVLDQLLKNIKLKRDDVYIANTVKCRPPLNRDPSAEEKEACVNYLLAQITAIKPKVIVCLGRNAVQSVFPHYGLVEEPKLPMRDLHGMVYEPDQLFIDNSRRLGDDAMADIKLMVCYHPAYALHNSAGLPAIKADFQKLRDYLDGKVGGNQTQICV
jgi:DNA polymerase